MFSIKKELFMNVFSVVYVMLSRSLEIRHCLQFSEKFM